MPAATQPPQILYEQARDLLLASRCTVLLTGAGVSTGSGIPDFRTPGRGMWQFVDPFDVASIWGFREDPERFYSWIRPLAMKIRNARPNPAHVAFARLQQAGLIATIITQNIDDLHQQAGASGVLHVHGRTGTATCPKCGHREAGEAFWAPFLAQGELPRCPNCGTVMKPDVVLFGEELPHETLMAAQQAALRCDVMLVAGTSLEVMPAADLPRLARRRGARLIILNLGATQLDRQADVVIREDVTISAPRLAQLCLDALEVDE